MDVKRARTILLVEDNAVTSLITEKIIKKYGYGVFTAYSGEQGVELALSDESIDLVLMDIDLGDGIDGTEAARRILSNRHVPIVFLTSHAEKDMVDKVKGITRYGYVIKSSGDFVLNSSIEMAFELFEANRGIEAGMAALRESEEMYRAIFMTSPDSININTIEGRYVDVNDGFTAVTGYTREEVTGVLPSEIMLWENGAEDGLNIVRMLRENGVVNNHVATFRHKDGHLFTGLLSARIININNSPHIFSVTRDISRS